MVLLSGSQIGLLNIFLSGRGEVVQTRHILLRLGQRTTSRYDVCTERVSFDVGEVEVHMPVQRVVRTIGDSVPWSCSNWCVIPALVDGVTHVDLSYSCRAMLKHNTVFVVRFVHL